MIGDKSVAYMSYLGPTRRQSATVTQTRRPTLRYHFDNVQGGPN